MWTDPNASKLRKIYVMVGCAMHTKMPTVRYLHGAHGAPYCDKTLNLLTLGLTLVINTLSCHFSSHQAHPVSNPNVQQFFRFH